jgi:ribosomal protein S18 acetylase RimI-like enzyme
VAEPTITRAGAEAIERLAPLWAALHEHHRQCAPEASELAEFRTTEESWKRRRARYEEWLARVGSFVLLAERDGKAVGYALVTLGGEGAALVTGVPTGELESLAILPEERGSGLGSALMDAVRSELRKAGVEIFGLGVMDGNVDAMRFYERQGMRRFMVAMVGRV